LPNRDEIVQMWLDSCTRPRSPPSGRQPPADETSLLRAEDGVRERRAQARHPAKSIPELLADGPSQVFTWDITSPKGPTAGITYDLYVMLDIYSRYVVGWRVEHRESAELATDFIATAIARNGGRPRCIVNSQVMGLVCVAVRVLAPVGGR
jgi:transposase InsO family protein